MASILDVLIEILKIDCGVVDCYYPNEIEAMFFLFLFPTIFIILFIYVLTNFIFRGGGMQSRGIRLLISVGAYAFIDIDNLFTLFVSLSQLWWLLTIILVGLYAFIRFLFTGSQGQLPGAGGGAIRGYLKGVAKDVYTGERKTLRLDIEANLKNLRAIVDQIKGGTPDQGRLVQSYNQLFDQTQKLIEILEERGELGGRNVEGLGKKYWKALDDIQHDYGEVSKRRRAA